MLLRPTAKDLRLVGFLLGHVFLVVAGAGLVPLAWSALAGEWHPFGSFLAMIGVFSVLGTAALRIEPKGARLSWTHGMVVVSLTWLVVPIIGAIPFVLSGHFADPLDALFDSVSGLTTTGLSVMSDLDHLAASLNVWRHLLQFLGGFGIVVAALTLFSGMGGITPLYFSEGKGERFLPSVSSMVRFLWLVSAVHFVAVGVCLTFVGWRVLGFDLDRAAFHAITMFLAGFSTGGFAPHSTSIGYYHSALFEVVAAVAMLGGAMSFGLHHALWRGRRREALANLETRTFASSVGLTLLVTVLGLAITGAFTAISGLTRQGLFQVFSAHTTTGWATVSSGELAQWGGFAFIGILAAMAIGGMASSTAGGVKALRVGLTIKSMVGQIKQVLLPQGAVVSRRFHQGGAQRLTADLTRSVMTISLLFVALYLLGAAIGFAYGIPLHLSIFESVSASATIGLSVGVTDAAMPIPLQLVYMLQMVAGRLEFLALFVMVGFLVAFVRGK